ncbi:MAG: HIT domain-containing protein [Armatimonadetes bacterium]|nr:HIT domain-containing protein [Armatimonadota bacterium]
MERMWAPWRIGYVTGERREGCVFCDKVQSDDDEHNHVLHRGAHNVVMLNTYPYNSGHLMVVPVAHVAELGDLSPEARAEMWELALLACRTLERALNCQGLNMGMNIGGAAGAGICDHIHLHIVPRWNGDTNYMTTCAETRVVPQSLDASYQQLQPVMQELAAEMFEE